MQIDGEQLIKTVALNKHTNRDEARKAFVLFCSSYEKQAVQMALIHCGKWRKPESVAYCVLSLYLRQSIHLMELSSAVCCGGSCLVDLISGDRTGRFSRVGV